MSAIDIAPPPPVEFHYTQTESFVAPLHQLLSQGGNDALCPSVTTRRD